MANTREKLIDLMTAFYGVDPGYYGVEAYPLADHLIANGVTVQEWISVKDRLPEMHTKVLCCGKKGGRFIAELSSWGHENHLYWTKRDGKGCSEPTHWMPLPQPPKDDKLEKLAEIGVELGLLKEVE